MFKKLITGLMLAIIAISIPATAFAGLSRTIPRKFKRPNFEIENPIRNLKSDLTIISVSHSPEIATHEDIVDIEIKIKNQGQIAAANFWVTVRLNPEYGIDGLHNDIYIPFLKKGERKTIHIPLHLSLLPNYRQNYTFEVKIDSTNIINESDESNNISNVYIFIEDPDINRAEAACQLVDEADLEIDTSGGSRFSDVPVDAWYYECVQTLLNHGIIRGYHDGTFRPLDPINRAEATKLVVSVFEIPIVDSEIQHYPDVAPDAWYYDYVETLWEATAGGVGDFDYPDGLFRPARNASWSFIPKASYSIKRYSLVVTRGEIACQLLEALEIPLNDEYNQPFPDVPVDHEFAACISTAKEYSIMVGFHDGTFRPNDLSSRAETAKLIVNAYDLPVDIEEGVQHFPDVYTDQWYYAWVEALYAALNDPSIITFNDGTFRPEEFVLRSFIPRVAEDLNSQL